MRVQHRSACPLDCPDACSLSVTVDAGRVVAVDGDDRNPLTAGFICAKVRRLADHVYSDTRVMTPLVRSGPKGSGQLEAVSWDDALGRVAARLAHDRDTYGGESILPFCYGGSNGHLTQDAVDARLFHRLGASRLLRTVCAAPSGAAAAGLYGKMPGVALQDAAHAQLIIVWGANPSASGIHLLPPIKAARERGAQLIVIDPRRTPLAHKADVHLPVRPGTDLPVALAMINALFESGAADDGFLSEHATGVASLRERAAAWPVDRAAQVAGIEAAQLRDVVRRYAAASPALIRCGWGPERNRNGGSAIAAILALPAIAGKFGVRAGGYTMSNSRAWDLEPGAAAGAPEPNTRAVNMNELGRTLLEVDDPAVTSLFVYNANPAMTIPDQRRVLAGLAREDLFTVVFDAVMTDTARWADVVLPATTFLEHHELARGYGAMVLQRARPVIEAVGEARPNYEVFAELCERLDLVESGDVSTPDAMVGRLIETSADHERIAGALAQTGMAEPSFGNTPIQFVDVFPGTPDRKVHLLPDALDSQAPAGLYGFRAEPTGGPLALISPASGDTISSTFGQLRTGIVAIQINPSDAAERGIVEGDSVRVFNHLGEVHCAAALTEAIRPGVAALPKGLWSHRTHNEQTANALAPATLSDIGGGACFNDARVEVEQLADISKGTGKARRVLT